MKIIILTENEIDELVRNATLGGGEGIICEYQGELLKILCRNRKEKPKIYWRSVSNGIRQNKREKVILLENHPHFINAIAITGLVCTPNGVFAGYSMTDRRDYNAIHHFKGQFGKLSIHINQLKIKLKLMHQGGIINGDVRVSNILADPFSYDTALCDLDNMQVGNYPIDLLCKEADDYLVLVHELDERFDIYRLNQLTHTLLKEAIEYGWLTPSRSYFEVMGEMNKLSPSYSGEYLIDHITSDEMHR